MIQSKTKNHSHTSAENAFRSLSNEMTVNVSLLVPQESRNVAVHPEGSVMDIHRVNKRAPN
jgi:hypothetical protein